MTLTSPKSWKPKGPFVPSVHIHVASAISAFPGSLAWKGGTDVRRSAPPAMVDGLRLAQRADSQQR